MMFALPLIVVLVPLFFLYFKKDPVECLSINDSVWWLLAHFIYYNYIQ
jgi:hypothetical protein